MLRRMLGLEPGPSKSAPVPGITEPRGAAEAGEDAGQAGPAAPPEGPWSLFSGWDLSSWIRGSLSTRYRFRRARKSGDEDQDIAAHLSLDFGDPELHAVTGHLSARGFVDLHATGPANAFFGLDRARGGSSDAYVTQAYLDLEEVEIDTVRIGRQDLYDTPVFVTFDGLRVETGPQGELGWWLGGYAGVPVHFFESSASGDELWGAAGGLRPWDGGRLRLDWVHLRDSWNGASTQDDLLGVTWWQRVGEETNLYGQHTWLEGKAKDLLLRATGSVFEHEIDYELSYRELLSTQREHTTELDPYFSIAREYRPYRQLGLSFTWRASEDLDVALGFDVRRLADASDEGTFNREYERFHVSPTFRGVFGEPLDLTLTAESWDTNGEDTFSLSGDLRWRLRPASTLVFGTSYHRFDYDTFEGKEQDRVRDVYLRLEHDPSSDLSLDFSYSFESNDFDEYHAVRLGLTWKF